MMVVNRFLEVYVKSLSCRESKNELLKCISSGESKHEFFESVSNTESKDGHG